MRARLAVIGLAAVWAGWVPAAAQAPPDLGALMTRVGERVAEYHRRAQNLICLERSTVQPVQTNLAPAGMSRTVESELRVETRTDVGGTLPQATVVRDVRRINGRAPRERDQKDRSGCTDPNPLSPEPLAFLLAGRRDEFRFTSLRTGKEQNRAALIVEFISANRASRPDLIEDERGHDDCFDWSGPVATVGRIWIDAESYDVLRVDRHINGPVDVRVPWPLQRRYNLAPSVVLDRDDQTLRFKAVTFRDPDEVLLLPASIESLTLMRGGLQSARRAQTFSNYRRFLTGGRVVK